MAGDNDFIKSGNVGGWVGETRIPAVYMRLSFFLCVSLSSIQYVHEFQYDMLAGGLTSETNLSLIPSALNRQCPPPTV